MNCFFRFLRDSTSKSSDPRHCSELKLGALNARARVPVFTFPSVDSARREKHFLEFCSSQPFSSLKSASIGKASIAPCLLRVNRQSQKYFLSPTIINLCDVCERSHREGFMLDKECLMSTERCEVQIVAVSEGSLVKLTRFVETRSRWLKQLAQV